MNRTLKSVEVKANNLLESHGLKSKGYTFKWNNRKSAFGVFKVQAKRIELSKYLCDELSDSDLEDTILHEIAHALAYEQYNKQGIRIKPHGREWKQIARSIGCNAERCGPKLEGKKGHIVYECPSCENTFHRHRRIKEKMLCNSCFRAGVPASECTITLQKAERLVS